MDVELHVLLVALGQDDDGLAARALVGQAELVDHVEHLVAPAQDERVPRLQHLRPAPLQALDLVPDRLCRGSARAGHARSPQPPLKQEVQESSPAQESEVCMC